MSEPLATLARFINAVGGPETIVAVVSTLVAVLGSLYKTGRISPSAETAFRRVISDKTDIIPSTKVVPEDELRAAVEEAAPDSANIDWMTLDGRYYAPDDAGPLRKLNPSLLPYRSDRFDCENYAFAFKTLSALIGGANTVCVVVDWDGGHAYNAIIDSSQTVHWYEPQDDEFVSVGEGMYDFEDVEIIL